MSDEKAEDEIYRRESAFLSDDPCVSSADAPIWADALSFCRRPYARRLDAVDLAVVGLSRFAGELEVGHVHVVTMRAVWGLV